MRKIKQWKESQNARLCYISQDGLLSKSSLIKLLLSRDPIEGEEETQWLSRGEFLGRKQSMCKVQSAFDVFKK